MASIPAELARPEIGLSAARARARALLRRHWSLVAVLAAFVLSMFIVPTLSNIPVSDDWVYTRSVQILLDQHRLVIFDLSVASLFFQVIWGALFGLIFGATFVATRISTLVMVFFGAVALYGLCRELGVSPGRSALGVAVYLFNPIAYSLAFSFMTDPQFLALLVISCYFYVRGLRPEAMSNRMILAGSIAAGLGFLVRQQGALIPLAVVTYLLLSRQLRPNRAGVVLFLRVVAIPAVMAILYYLWLYLINGVPTSQTRFLRSVEETGIRQNTVLVERLTFIELGYVGLFVLPIAIGAGFGLWRLVRTQSRLGWLVFAVIGLGFLAALVHYWRMGLRMPYVPHFFGPAGLGPSDLLGGGRPWLLGDNQHLWALSGLTAICALATFLIILALSRMVRLMVTPAGAGAALIIVIAFWQVIGILPPSYSFKNWKFRGLPAPSLDRYLLPLMPLAIVLLLWALRDVRIFLPVAWVVVALMTFFSVTATRDSFVYLKAIWTMAEDANHMGIANTTLDAGAAWDGYHLYEYSMAYHIPVQTRGGLWWLSLFAPATNSNYVVAGAPLRGYTVLTKREYSQWLQRQPVYLYLERRNDVPGPP